MAAAIAAPSANEWPRSKRYVRARGAYTVPRADLGMARDRGVGRECFTAHVQALLLAEALDADLIVRARRHTAERRRQAEMAGRA